MPVRAVGDPDSGASVGGCGSRESRSLGTLSPTAGTAILADLRSCTCGMTCPELKFGLKAQVTKLTKKQAVPELSPV
ncbi:MAG: hypothetical protein HC895_06370 [Leptolyngbyaceae cyanobacterium SM1_3_5]|nr:hypothetical protein [Leptolyngbyaceae cyanobacterium SM1_3_5]